MIRQTQIIEKIIKYQPKADIDIIKKAYQKASLVHKKQQRESGEPYINHPYQVALMLTEYHLDDVTIAAALLHDVIEDSNLTKKDINEEFGAEITFLVDGLTKFDKINILNNTSYNANNFHKLFGAISQDIRVLFIKLIDRLHNMRTIDNIRDDKKIRIAEETIKIYAPLARIMGIEKISSELREIAFRVINKEKYEHIVNRIKENESLGREHIRKTTAILQQKMKQNNIEADIKGRIKTPASIWEKMKRKNISFNRMVDICAFRILVENEMDCYRALGVIHREFSIIPGKFKDYISAPKKNSYRSIHTIVWGEQKQKMELQIRTYQMDEIADIGIASHSLYKIDGKNQFINFKDNNVVKKFSRGIKELQNSEISTREFFQNALLELDSDQIFCFTPAGDIVALTRNSCALDFAYAVHTEVGLTALSCLVNNARKSLAETLKNGDEVHIVTGKQKQSQYLYESFLKTGRAISIVRRTYADENIKRNYDYGIKIIDRRASRAGIEISKNTLEKTAKILGYESHEKVIVALGNNDVERKSFFQILAQALPKHIANEEVVKKINTPAVDLNDRDMPVIGGDGEKKLFFGDFIGAVPGDKIVGLAEGENSIAVYSVLSQAFRTKINQTPKQKTYKLDWDVVENSNKRYYAVIKLDFHDQIGAIAKITSTISSNDVDITNLVLLKFGEFYKFRIDVRVFNAQHVEDTIEKLKELNIVSNPQRSFG